MTCTQTVVSYFEAHPQVTESVREQFVSPRTIQNFFHLCISLNTECIQYRSLLVPSLMPTIKARTLGLCTRNTTNKVDYKSQRLADYFSSTHSKK
jgi:hypothetical protein